MNVPVTVYIEMTPNPATMKFVANKYLFAFNMYGHFGPKLTFKSLTNNAIFDGKALDINNWKYSLGDLELF